MRKMNDAEEGRLMNKWKNLSSHNHKNITFFPLQFILVNKVNGKLWRQGLCAHKSVFSVIVSDNINKIMT